MVRGNDLLFKICVSSYLNNKILFYNVRSRHFYDHVITILRGGIFPDLHVEGQ